MRWRAWKLGEVKVGLSKLGGGDFQKSVKIKLKGFFLGSGARGRVTPSFEEKNFSLKSISM